MASTTCTASCHARASGERACSSCGATAASSSWKSNRSSSAEASWIAGGRESKIWNSATARSGGPSHHSHRLIAVTSVPARRRGLRFLQLRRALLAAHLDRLATDRHLDRVLIELVVASRACLLGHVCLRGY